jgi:hypothetical protein
LRRFRLALAVMLLGLHAALAGAADRQDLLGTWYGETQDSAQLEGLSFDMRRWTVVQTPDGTGLQIMHYLNSGFRQRWSCLSSGGSIETPGGWSASP